MPTQRNQRNQKPESTFASKQCVHHLATHCQCSNVHIPGSLMSSETWFSIQMEDEIIVLVIKFQGCKILSRCIINCCALFRHLVSLYAPGSVTQTYFPDFIVWYLKHTHTPKQFLFLFLMSVLLLVTLTHQASFSFREIHSLVLDLVGPITAIYLICGGFYKMTVHQAAFVKGLSQDALWPAPFFT